MNLSIQVNQNELLDLLLNMSTVRPVFIWGAPGIGKSSIVNQFADAVGLPCISMLGSQLAPEDIIGVPKIIDDKYSIFCPPKSIARNDPYVLFLDELNACSHEVQKAFYSLILDRRIGDYQLPEGSVVIGAGNRAQDNAITRNISSALINRMFHVELKVDVSVWLDWAMNNDIHHYIYEYIKSRPDHLFSQPPKTEEPFSTPRSWHMLSDAIKSYGDDISEHNLSLLTYGSLSASHAVQFLAFIKQIRNKYSIKQIINGNQKWPNDPNDRDVLYFLAQSLRSQLLKELPASKTNMSKTAMDLATRAKALLVELANISLEITQMIVASDGEGESLPSWYIVDIIKDIPGLAKKMNG